MWQVIELEGTEKISAAYPRRISTHRLAMKLGLLAAGASLLLGMEVGYSLALRKYAIPGEKTSALFFNGPITALSADFQRIATNPRPSPGSHRRL